MSDYNSRDCHARIQKVLSVGVQVLSFDNDFSHKLILQRVEGVRSNNHENTYMG